MAFWKKIGQQLGDLVDDLASPDEVRAELKQGIAALDAGRFVEAEEALRRLLTMDPDHWRGWHLLGLSLMGQERLDQAVECLERAAKARAKDLSVWADLAEARWRNEDPNAALETYRQALRCGGSDEDMARVYHGMGRIYLRQGCFEHALRELRKAVALTGGEDPELLGLLGQAQFGTGKMLELARQSLERAADAPEPGRKVLLLLAEVLLQQGRVDDAMAAPQRLLEADAADVDARCLLARCLLAQGGGQAEEARLELLRALQDAPRRPEIHRLLGQVHAASGDPTGALAHLENALQLAGEDGPAAGQQGQPTTQQLLRQLLRLELQQQPLPPRAERHARQLLATRPADALGLAALGVALAQPQPQQALELLSRSLAAGESFPARLGLGLTFLIHDRPAEAATALRAALRMEPRNSVARSLLEQAYDELAGITPGLLDGGAEFYPMLRRIQQLLEGHPALAELGPEIARIQEIFDRPLLITVMGEFNSGKSTLVNALIGETIAPMGITPTTATINILKYGEKAKARVVGRDDTEQLLGWSEVGPFLNGLNDRQARAIRHVELLYPAEELLRVNVVDTPGLNSLVDEHEQTAREILGKADAVIWLFAAQQAGKQTEQEALEVLRQHRLKTVGVLNKIDRLSADELEAVQGHLSEGFAELVDAVIPVSARQALEAMGATPGDENKLQQSRFPELRSFLEQRLFAHSLQIKRQASSRRLEGILAEARQRMATMLEQAEAALRSLEQLQQQPGLQLSARLLDAERGTLIEAVERVYRQGAAEVLDFVRPRQWRLGQHQAARADRDFLLELLLDGLRREVSETSQQRITAALLQLGSELQGQLDEALAGAALVSLRPRREALEQLLRERLSLLQQQVYTRYMAFARGYLSGGKVDHFFTEKLPRLDLSEETVFAALVEDSVDLEQELLAPLLIFVLEAAEELERQLRQLRDEAELVCLELDRRWLGPLMALEASLKAP